MARGDEGDTVVTKVTSSDSKVTRVTEGDKGSKEFPLTQQHLQPGS